MRDVMEGFKERRNSKTLGSFSISKGSPVEPWHSTPVKQNLFAANEAPDISSTKLRDENRTRPAGLCLHDLSKPMSSFSLTQDFQTPVNGLEVSTIQRQRLELQLLIAELKDRDQELNTMAAAHHKQLLSWEQDRQRVLILEQRCARLEDELDKRNEVIRALSKRSKVVELREKDVYRELNSTQQQLHELSCRQMNTTRHEQDLEERNQSLNSTVMILSSQVGQLQVREEELSSMLKLKDKDMIEATNHILELSGRLCELEKSLEELRTRESKTLREMEEHKHRFRESRHKNAQLKAEFQEKTIENNSQREELIRLKQENQLLKKDITSVELQMMNEDKSWRDELLELSRSKQARVESELLCLRQVCESQQNDLQLLKLNLESAREALRHHEGQRSHERADSGLGDSHVLENSDHQEGTELETGLMSTMCHSTSGNAPSILMQRPCVEMETQTDFEHDFGAALSTTNHEFAELSAVVDSCCGTNIKNSCATSQCDINEQESPKMEMKERVNSCVEPSSQSLCCDNADSPSEDPHCQAVYCDTRADVDLIAVIDYDSETGTPVCVVEVDISPRISCAADLSLLHLDCPSPCHRSRRSSVCLPDSTLSIELCANDVARHGNEEGYSSSTTRLQRLLAESQEMVASLGSSTKKSVSPTKPQSPMNCDAICHLHSNHGNGSHSQTSTHCQEGRQTHRESDSQIESSPCLHQESK
ncbi:coiled-coil domain-containing protein 62 isoform X1 [Onychostoma macrolepis]|uniref:coiled-coil domain-containing protein 62 isoform X1 n=1 Tax=Onychostoma macrolepis TaxID=369639 RepID=UPI00272A07AC|nr:coiled-coil domain-containing protein 62 isoform X1 [Onychostoma macrolepis]